MGPVRDQGAIRGTCAAFALVACLEWREYERLQKSGPPEPMSEQYLFWAAKQEDRQPTDDSADVLFAAVALSKRGTCRASLWPYQSGAPRAGQDAITHADGTHPSATDHQDAARWACPAVTPTAMRTPADVLRDGLSRAGAVALSLDVLRLYDKANGLPIMPQLPDASGGNVEVTNWVNESTVLDGVILDEQVDPRYFYVPSGVAHAVCVLEHPPLVRDGHSWFLFRNSFGRNWGRFPGLAHVPEGYGFVSEWHVNRYAYQLAYLPR